MNITRTAPAVRTRRSARALRRAPVLAAAGSVVLSLAAPIAGAGSGPGWSRWTRAATTPMPPPTATPAATLVTEFLVTGRRPAQATRC